MKKWIRKNKNKKNLLTDTTMLEVYVPFAFAFVLTCPFFGWMLVSKKGYDFQLLGPYGDFLGGSTVPFLTFITILLLIRTVSIQSNQLDVQKDEFKLLRDELESTKEALQEQGKTARIQRFENSFSIQIEELRKVKIEIEKPWDDTDTTNGHKYISQTNQLPYKEIMEYISERINNWTFDEMASSLAEKDSPDYFHMYWKTYNNAYLSTILESDKLNSDTFNRYFFIIERIILLIYHNKNIMDEWEMEFYIESLYEEISTQGFNLVLFHLAYHTKQRQKVKELELVQYVYALSNNYEFINTAFIFLLNGSDGWYNKKARE
ncbi:hypothetical protein [Peribacillus sp. FSL E2-0218]|uniref:hypothetical protein n=1 Tax=Peribacillus sp. FSL E2-0218 TaxID=2921364 RepID=UPI0030EEF45D